MSATETLERMLQAINSHDIGAMLGCFTDDYRCEIPRRPWPGAGVSAWRK
ncbi:MAG: nuclear transport factor 2 family protein [Acetobacteraceae bacterium]|nr:nuclear transport factor 2 family protein [Acetobacteraceae bacterium]